MNTLIYKKDILLKKKNILEKKIDYKLILDLRKFKFKSYVIKKKKYCLRLHLLSLSKFEKRLAMVVV